MISLESINNEHLKIKQFSKKKLIGLLTNTYEFFYVVAHNRRNSLHKLKKNRYKYRYLITYHIYYYILLFIKMF